MYVAGDIVYHVDYAISPTLSSDEKCKLYDKVDKVSQFSTQWEQIEPQVRVLGTLSKQGWGNDSVMQDAVVILWRKGRNKTYEYVGPDFEEDIQYFEQRRKWEEEDKKKKDEQMMIPQFAGNRGGHLDIWNSNDDW